MSPALLCPLSDFPYMLPGCAPLLECILLVGLLLLGLLLLLLVRPRAASAFLVALRGKVVSLFLPEGAAGGPAAGPVAALQLRSGQQLIWVKVDEAALPGRHHQLRVGQRLSVFGVPGLVQVPGEQLYRQPAQQEGVWAIRIVGGRLALDLVLGSAALLLLVLELWLVQQLWRASGF